jgi:hypothetical protein
LQVITHAVPLQVVLPFGSVGQGVHDDGPQVATLVFDAHWSPHRWVPVPQAAAMQVAPEQA